MILERDRRTEHAEQLFARNPLHGCAGSLELVDRPRKRRVGCGSPPLRVLGVGDRREVCEEDGDQLSLTRPERRCSNRRRARVELGLLIQDRAFESLQRRAGLEAELVGQRVARRAVRVERLCLSACAVEREHQLAAQPFPQGMLCRERLQLGDELGRGAIKREVGLEAFLQRRQAEVLEARNLGLSEPVVGDVGERRPTPFGQCARQRRGRLGCSSVRESVDAVRE